MLDARGCDEGAGRGLVHNIERAGDRIVNICERIAFTATGELRDLD
ncbi:MAG: hypothetical protein QUS11_09700 [Candidatus Fermentibacter sp.]|nr:hypothetical protein [Candidatus Fermentibacter sp.]